MAAVDGCAMGVEPKIGGVNPPKWMVKIMENPIKHGMIWGVFPYFGNTHINDGINWMAKCFYYF